MSSLVGVQHGGSSQQRQQSTTMYPWEFLGNYQNQFGRGFSMDELTRSLGGTQSIFGPSQGNGQPQGYGGGAPQGAQGGGAPQGGGQPPGGNRPAGTVSMDQISSMLNTQYFNRPDLASQTAGRVRDWAVAQGYDPNALTPDQLRQAIPERSGRYGDYVRNTLPGLAESYSSGPQEPRYQPNNGPDLSGLQIPQTIQRMFAPRDPYTPMQLNDVPGITAPTAQSQQMNVAPGGFDKLEQSMFHSMYDPQAREIRQQGDIADRRLQAELAQSGLASSGTGIGQVQQQRLDRGRDLQNRAADAAYQASTARFGQEYAQQQFNATQRQQTALANAGMDLTAQTQNAANVLAGNTQASENYLKTLGLNEQSAAAMRGDFMNFLGLTEQDLQRVDQSNKDNLGLLLNAWLQQGALLGNLGQRSQGGGSSGGGWSFNF